MIDEAKIEALAETIRASWLEWEQEAGMCATSAQDSRVGEERLRDLLVDAIRSALCERHFTNIHGPQKCPRRCSECPDGNHHWLTVTFPGCLDEECDDWEESLNHPAVQEWLTIRKADGTVFVKGEFKWEDGHITYLQCKHCEAWHELTEAMLDDPDFCIV